MRKTVRCSAAVGSLSCSSRLRFVWLVVLGVLVLLVAARAAPGQWSSLLNGSPAEPVNANITFPLKKVWEVKAQGYWGFRSSPAIHDGTVYVGSMSSTFYAVDAGSGAVRWEKQVGDRIEFSSPAVDARGVYVGCEDGNLYAFDHAGNIQWKTPTGAKIEGSPIIHGDLVLVGNKAGSLLVLNRPDGSVTWRVDCDGPIFARPTVAHDTMYVGTEGFEGGTLLPTVPSDSRSAAGTSPATSRHGVAFTLRCYLWTGTSSSARWTGRSTVWMR